MNFKLCLSPSPLQWFAQQSSSFEGYSQTLERYNIATAHLYTMLDNCCANHCTHLDSSKLSNLKLPIHYAHIYTYRGYIL